MAASTSRTSRAPDASLQSSPPPGSRKKSSGDRAQTDRTNADLGTSTHQQQNIERVRRLLASNDFEDLQEGLKLFHGIEANLDDATFHGLLTRAEFLVRAELQEFQRQTVFDDDDESAISDAMEKVIDIAKDRLSRHRDEPVMGGFDKGLGGRLRAMIANRFEIIPLESRPKVRQPPGTGDEDTPQYLDATLSEQEVAARQAALDDYDLLWAHASEASDTLHQGAQNTRGLEPSRSAVPDEMTEKTIPFRKTIPFPQGDNSTPNTSPSDPASGLAPIRIGANNAGVQLVSTLIETMSTTYDTIMSDISTLMAQSGDTQDPSRITAVEQRINLLASNLQIIKGVVDAINRMIKDNADVQA